MSWPGGPGRPADDSFGPHWLVRKGGYAPNIAYWNPHYNPGGETWAFPCEDGEPRMRLKPFVRSIPEVTREWTYLRPCKPDDVSAEIMLSLQGDLRESATRRKLYGWGLIGTLLFLIVVYL